ncbi:hypothetical protein MIND_00540100 [Mycena indigotica]|uniref:F-box domain-containing protein n=1 Tax=Mycena indigotica TaxID=2126181 RepID=A0A8H6W796_9AGAR|nr:uncharacterized protein MIND_00540100 [Mycena indigotica]KAF7307457.1 hypothetical protein MIND_00540100 [Mycena indigotica]
MLHWIFSRLRTFQQRYSVATSSPVQVPNEIYGLIASHLPTETLLVLCGVSRSVYLEANRYLYSALTITPIPVENWQRRSAKQQLGTQWITPHRGMLCLRLWIKALGENSKLPVHVRSVVLNLPDDFEPDDARELASVLCLCINLQCLELRRQDMRFCPIVNIESACIFWKTLSGCNFQLTHFRDTFFDIHEAHHNAFQTFLQRQSRLESISVYQDVGECTFPRLRRLEIVSSNISLAARSSSLEQMKLHVGEITCHPSTWGILKDMRRFGQRDATNQLTRLELVYHREFFIVDVVVRYVAEELPHLRVLVIRQLRCSIKQVVNHNASLKSAMKQATQLEALILTFQPGSYADAVGYHRLLNYHEQCAPHLRYIEIGPVAQEGNCYIFNRHRRPYRTKEYFAAPYSVDDDIRQWAYWKDERKQ